MSLPLTCRQRHWWANREKKERKCKNGEIRENQSSEKNRLSFRHSMSSHRWGCSLWLVLGSYDQNSPTTPLLPADPSFVNFWSIQSSLPQANSTGALLSPPHSCWVISSKQRPSLMSKCRCVFYCTPNHTHACLLNISTWTLHRFLDPNTVSLNHLFMF